MALTRGRLVGLIAAAGLLALALGYLRDPPWLIDAASGLRPWQTDAEGTRYRVASGRASFFVPADAVAVTIPLRAEFSSPADWPVTVTLEIDGTAADRRVLADGGWHTVRLRLPPRGSRRVRRIDVHSDRLRAGGRGVHIGELAIAGHRG